ncbi:MAG: DUF1080 domain-containing protein [Zavarzinella sp.]
MRMIFTLTTILVISGTTLAQYGELTGLKILKPEDTEHVKSTPAPAGAKVLFDGKSLEAWGVKGKPDTAASWKIVDGAMECAKGDIVTKELFGGSFKLHVEFRVPYVPKGVGQGRGNSGVYVQGRYEVQVLDSYGLESKTNDCGAIYEVAKPLVNACKAPTIWQSYDIEFHAPKFEGTKKVEPARMTVHHNGVKIHDNVKIESNNTRAGMGGDPSKPGPIMLQDHGHPVQYRNIWLLPIQ